MTTFISIAVAALGLGLVVWSLAAVIKLGTGSFLMRLGLILISLLVTLEEFRTFNGRYTALVAVSCTLLLGFMVAASWPQVSGRPPVGVLWLLPVLSFWLFLINGFNSLQTPLMQTTARLAPCVLIMLLVMAIGSGALQPRLIGYCVHLAFGVSCLLSSTQGSAWADCSAFKCGPAGLLFVGPFTSENFMARLACLSILTLGVSRSKASFAVTLPLGLTVLFVADSRTSQLALVVALAMSALVLATGRFGRVLAAAVVATLLILGVIIVYTAHPADFSNRGGIWRLGTAALGNDWVLGAGLDNWSGQVLARNYMHSQSLLLLYAGGLVAWLLYGAMLMSSVLNAVKRSSFFGVSLIVFIAMTGLTEIVWNPLAVDGSLLVLMILASVGFIGRDGREGHRTPAGAGINTCSTLR